MRKIILAFGLGLFAILHFTPASAQQNCGDRTKIITQLKVKYGEVQRSMGLGRDNGIIEIFASRETGTWTILFTRPNGTSCLLAAGEAFQSVPAEMTDTPDDA